MDNVLELIKINNKFKNNMSLNNQITNYKKMLRNNILNESEANIIKDEIQNIKCKIASNDDGGLNKYAKYILSEDDLNNVNENQVYLYEKLLVKNSLHMFFAASGIGKSLISIALANECLYNNTVEEVVVLDFDMGELSLKNRDYENLFSTHKKRFNYILGQNLLLNNIDPFQVLIDLSFDKTVNRLLIIDSGSHIVYDGTNNERKSLIQFFSILKNIRKLTNTSILLIHHSHRTRNGEKADFHGSFEWKRDLDFQYVIRKNESQNIWLLEKTKDRDNLIENHAFKYDDFKLTKVDYKTSNYDENDIYLLKEVNDILDIFIEINQNDLISETKSIRSKVGIGEKRFALWLKKMSSAGEFIREKKTHEKNAIVFTKKGLK